jgi:hypothetical protein
MERRDAADEVGGWSHPTSVSNPSDRTFGGSDGLDG